MTPKARKKASKTKAAKAFEKRFAEHDGYFDFDHESAPLRPDDPAYMRGWRQAEKEGPPT